MSAIIVTVEHEEIQVASAKHAKEDMLVVTEAEASILLEAYTWICRRDDIYQKLASHIDLDDKTLLGLNLKVNKFLRSKS